MVTSTDETVNPAIATSHPNYVDARGLICPQPVLLASRHIKTLAVGEEILVHVTDPHAELDFEVYCQRTGHQLLMTESLEDSWLLKIRKTG